MDNPVMAVMVSVIGGIALGAGIYVITGLKKEDGPVTGAGGRKPLAKPKVREQEDDIEGRSSGKAEINRVTPQREWRGGGRGPGD